MEGGIAMTSEEFLRIITIIHVEMAKVDADVMDYQKIGKAVAALAMFQLLAMGADDREIKEALCAYTDSIKEELKASWGDIKRKCIIIPN